MFAGSYRSSRAFEVRARIKTELDLPIGAA
jgi:hypothetical protein